MKSPQNTSGVLLPRSVPATAVRGNLAGCVILPAQPALFLADAMLEARK